MYFYLVFAASLLLFRSAKFALPFVSFVIILNVLFIGKLASSDFLRNPIALEFLAGMALASMFKTLRPSHLAAILMTCIAAASIYLASALTNSPDTGGLGRDRRWLAWGLPAAILVLAAIFQAKHPSRAGRFLLLLGDSSYALYLTHSIVMTIYAWALLHGMWKAVPMWVIIPSVLAFCVLLAIFVHKTIEAPLQYGDSGTRFPSCIVGIFLPSRKKNLRPNYAKQVNS
jgi:peptidoglycan/LPS O-acetylase OafA/YrhL